jgi:CheY-like chemotaxis protein
MKTLLVAVRAEDKEQASVIAAHEFRVYLASTTKEALGMLSAIGLDGIVCGVHFNDGDPFEFLRQARRLPQAASLPFIMVKAVEGRLHAESYRAVEMACAQEGLPYLDAAELIRQYGPDVGYAKLRQLIAGILG